MTLSVKLFSDGGLSHIVHSNHRPSEIFCINSLHSPEFVTRVFVGRLFFSFANQTLVNLFAIQIGQQAFHHEVFSPLVARFSLNHEAVKSKKPQWLHLICGKLFFSFHSQATLNQEIIYVNTFYTILCRNRRYPIQFYLAFICY